MATPNPLAALIVQRLAQMQAGGGVGGAGGGFPPAGPATDAGTEASYGRELAMLREADPAAMMRNITQVKQMVIAIINQTGMSLPGIARSMSKTLAGLDAAMKEAQQAAATASVVAPPIQSPVSLPGLSTPAPGPMPM